MVDLMQLAGIGGTAVGVSIVVSAIDKYSDELKKASKEMKALEGILKGAGLAAAGFATLAINEYNKSVQSVKKLEFAIKNTYQTKILKDYAKELSLVTNATDEQVMDAMRLMSVMGLTADQIKENIGLVIDLSEAYGVDLESATKAVAAAMKGEFGLIGRITKEEIKNQEQLSEVLQRSSGFAKESVDPVNQLAKSYSEMAESVGEILYPAFKRIAEILSHVADWVSEHKKLAAVLVDIGLALGGIYLTLKGIAAIQGITALLGALGGGGTVAGVAARGVGAAVGAAATGIPVAIVAIAGVAAAAIGAYAGSKTGEWLAAKMYGEGKELLPGETLLPNGNISFEITPEQLDRIKEINGLKVEEIYLQQSLYDQYEDYKSKLEEINSIQPKTLDDLQMKMNMETSLNTVYAAQLPLFQQKFALEQQEIEATKQLNEAIKGVVESAMSAHSQGIRGFERSMMSQGKYFDLSRKGPGRWNIDSGTPVKVAATGGLVAKPTLTVVGEAGPEMITPVGKSGGVGGNIYVSIGEINGIDASEISRALREELKSVIAY